MNKKENIIDSWIMVEHLSEGDINIRDKSIKPFENLENVDFYSMFIDEIKKKKFEKYQKGGIVVYFDVFNFEEVVSLLREKYHLNSTDEDIRVGDKFSFALCFDKNLNLCSDMTFFTESAYIRWYQKIPSKKEFREYESNFKTVISQFYDESSENPSAFNEAISKTLKNFDVNLKNCRMQIVNNLETEATNLHSFFIDDLEKAKTIKTENLESYLLGKTNRRVNLDSKIDSNNFNPEAFQRILQPKNYPIARFPSNTEYSLSLMQQVAVNLAIGYDNKQIRSVNGPPGTGKTTLLKDIFAELIVRQAYDIANLSEKSIKGSDRTVYFEKASIGEIPSVIAENNIIVASSNNSAVRNIVNEIPLIKEIDDNLVEELKCADYFVKIANSKVSTKWIDGENDKKKEVLVMAPLSGEDKFWGLFSLEGGKLDNMTHIITNLKHVVDYLENEYISNDEIYEEFKKQYNEVAKIRAQLQEYVTTNEKYKVCCKDLEKLEETYRVERESKEKSLSALLEDCREKMNETTSEIDCLNKHLSDIGERKETIERNRNSLELSLQLLREEKPCFLSPRKLKIEYKNKLSELSQQLLACVNESKENDDETKKVRSEIQVLQNKTTECITQQQIEQQRLSDWVLSKEDEISKLEAKRACYEKKLSEKNVKMLDMSLKYEELQLLNPYFDEYYRIAQSKLFVAALKVRKQFLYDNRKNLKAAIIIWNKQNEQLDKKHIIVAAWNWINMTIPVISSTFASFSRMCRNMGAETLGHLFIDEAGQALPQASVGAIYRSKHIMVVGDPSQIKPVLTLDSNVLGMLGEHYKVSKKYLSNATSTQTLVDEISQYGFYREQDASSESWIGIPLWVHRRCKDPMFTISNKISYKGFMVQGKPGNGKAEWFDIKGKADNKYVKEQGEFLVKKLKEMIENNPKIIDKNGKDVIYVITPFSNVAYHLSQELKKINFTRYDEHNKPTNVGTIHTFQGKEASVVFLVLGADNSSSGAARWAVDEPNMMNVAATRAKDEFYIIGDQNLYLNLGCDVATDTYQIITRHK